MLNMIPRSTTAQHGGAGASTVSKAALFSISLPIEVALLNAIVLSPVTNRH